MDLFVELHILRDVNVEGNNMLNCHYKFMDGTKCIYEFAHVGGTHQNADGVQAPNAITMKPRKVIQ